MLSILWARAPALASEQDNTWARAGQGSTVFAWRAEWCDLWPSAPREKRQHFLVSNSQARLAPSSKAPASPSPVPCHGKVRPAAKCQPVMSADIKEIGTANESIRRHKRVMRSFAFTMTGNAGSRDVLKVESAGQLQCVQSACTLKAAKQECGSHATKGRSKTRTCQQTRHKYLGNVSTV